MRIPIHGLHPKFHLRQILNSRFLLQPKTQHFRSSAVSQDSEVPTGLYGFDHLKTAKGFRRFVDDAIERSGELVNYISKMSSSAEII